MQILYVILPVRNTLQKRYGTSYYVFLLSQTSTKKL